MGSFSAHSCKSCDRVVLSDVSHLVVIAQASAVSEENYVLWCCLVCGPRKQYPTFCYHSPHL